MNISDENKAPVIVDLLIKIYTQNRVLAEMQLPIYCQAKGITEDRGREVLNDFFDKKKMEKEDAIYAEFGSVSIADILG